MIEIQQKSVDLILTSSHILCMKIRINNKKINCKKFVSKKNSDYFFTWVYMYVFRLSSHAIGIEFDQVMIPCKFSSYTCTYVRSPCCLIQFYLLFISSLLICTFSSPFSLSPNSLGLMLFVFGATRNKVNLILSCSRPCFHEINYCVVSYILH